MEIWKQRHRPPTSKYGYVDGRQISALETFFRSIDRYRRFVCFRAHLDIKTALNTKHWNLNLKSQFTAFTNFFRKRLTFVCDEININARKKSIGKIYQYNSRTVPNHRIVNCTRKIKIKRGCKGYYKK